MFVKASYTLWSTVEVQVLIVNASASNEELGIAWCLEGTDC